jgi:hypothetical protein
MPSLFAKNSLNKRYFYKFLKDFGKEISKPIKKNHMEHLDYVPTQFFCEYFRYVFKDKNKQNIDGIIYNSSKNHGKCCVLFVENKECVDTAKNSAKLILHNTKFKKI